MQRIARIRPRAIGFRSDPATTISHLHDAFRSVRPIAAWRHFNSLLVHKRHTLKPDDFTTILGFITQHSKPLLADAHSARVVFHMRQCGFTFNVRDYHSIMLIHLNAGCHDRVVAAFDDMWLMDGVKQDIVCWNLLMHSWMLHGDLEGLVTTWRSAVAAYPASRLINMDGWAFIIEGHARAGKINEAFALLEHLKDRIKETRHVLTDAVMNAHIKVLGIAGRGQEAIDLFLDTYDLDVKEFQPSAQSFTSSNEYLSEIQHGTDNVSSTEEVQHLETSAKKTIDSIETPSGNSSSNQNQSKMKVSMLNFDAIIESTLKSNDIPNLTKTWSLLLDYCIANNSSRCLDFPLKLGAYPHNLEFCMAKFSKNHQKRRMMHPLPQTIERMIVHYQSTNQHEALQRLFSYALDVSLPTVLSFETCVDSLLNTGEDFLALNLYNLMRDTKYLPRMELVYKIGALKARIMIQAQDPEAVIEEEW